MKKNFILLQNTYEAYSAQIEHRNKTSVKTTEMYSTYLEI